MTKKKAPRKRRPHKLELYRRAVQHPLAEVTFLQRVYEHYSIYGAKLLREDFAGTCALSSMWVNLRDNYEAMAIEKHGPTVRWAQRTALKELGTDNIYLHIVEADVMDLYEPRVDITCALNFSTFIYHDRDELAEYFVNAYRGLKKRGIFVMDAYGGPGAMRVGTQSRHVPPENEYDKTDRGFEYHWEQRSFDALTHRTDCRIHFTLPDGHYFENAFRYNWRLWTLPELVEIMSKSGFRSVGVWCDTFDPDTGTSDGKYKPVEKLPAREDWVAYVVGIV